MIIFRLTISGGLEDYCVREIEKLLPTAQLSWVQRGNSGSQLNLKVIEDEVSSFSEEHFVTSFLTKLHYVEYIYMVVYSTPVKRKAWSSQKSHEDNSILLDIKNTLMAQWDTKIIQVAMTLSRSVQAQFLNCNVGMEPLPGKLLPECSIDTEKEEIPIPQGVISSFQVNTIYTKSTVAEFVVERFLELVHEQIEISKHDKILWLDAGAGSGELWNHLPSTNRIGIDIAPSSPNILENDFLSTTMPWLRQKAVIDFEQICIISNPPFATGSRGNFSIIVDFLNHSFQTLQARYVGLIVPAKFVRQRIWTSLGLTSSAQLLSRFLLPQSSFFDPTSQKPVHIQSYFLFFGQRMYQDSRVESYTLDDIESGGFYLQGKRDKSLFPDISTNDLVQTIKDSLTSSSTPLSFASERDAEFALVAKLLSHEESPHTEVLMLLNKEKPLSLVNSFSCQIQNHSVGWMSTSVKPSVAKVMLDSAIDRLENGALVVNCMSGEGTLELETQSFSSQSSSFFMIGGDSDEKEVYKTQERVRQLERNLRRHVPVDMVIWDAENLPLRSNVADMVLGDLPFCGSRSKKHQKPSSSNGPTSSLPSGLNYKRVMTCALCVLCPMGKASLISADSKALVHSTGQLNWRRLSSISRINLGGLNAQLLVLQKQQPCHKDLSLWLRASAKDLSEVILTRSKKATAAYYLNDILDLQKINNQEGVQEDDQTLLAGTPLVTDVQLFDTYFHEKSGKLSHCYRIFFDGRLTNVQTKILEGTIRRCFQDNTLDIILGLR